MTLVLGAALNRYQSYQGGVRSIVRRLDTGAVALVSALAALGGVPLSREMRLTLRSEVLARLRRIRRLHRRYPDILKRIAEAERALSAEGPAPPGGVGPIRDQQELGRKLAALDSLGRALRPGQMLQPLPADVRNIFRRHLADRRAEVISRYHLVEAGRCERQGHAMRARTHLMALAQGLRQSAPATEFVRELYRETNAALSGLDGRRLITGPPG